jgi:leader peptidase (prepilin peptidase)/N-methyltransferase
VLGPSELVPVLSFLLLRGKCKQCGTSISWRYASIELTTGLLFLLSYLVLAPQTTLGLLMLLRIWSIVSVLVVVFVIDFEHFLILDRILLPATCALLVSNIVIDAVGHTLVFGLHSLTVAGLLAALVAAGFFFALWLFSRGAWIGFGDVKFALFLGLATLWPAVLVCLFLSFIIGAVFAIFLLISGRKTLGSAVPFGTFLSIGCVLSVLWGPTILSWYLSLLGLG